MLPSLCHSSLLSDATISQTYYLIHWSKKPGALYVTEQEKDALVSDAAQSDVGKEEKSKGKKK